MAFSFVFAIFSIVLVACFVSSRGQVVDDPVVCAVGVKWFDGDVRLDDLVTGTSSILTTVNDNLNSMTRDESSGVFYFASGYTHHVWKYDPCNGDTNATKVGTINGMSGTSYGLAFCVDNKELYTTAASNLYSVDLDSLDATFIGNVGSATQGLECDTNGDLYGSQNGRGLVKIDKYDASVTVIRSSVPSLLYLTYDPNNDNILYGGDYNNNGEIIEINKTNGAYTVTSLIDDATSSSTTYRGMIILDQDSCDSVIDCPSYVFFCFLLFFCNFFTLVFYLCNWVHIVIHHIY